MTRTRITSLLTIGMILLATLTTFGQRLTIPWAQDIKLTWDDFQGPIDPASSFAAYTNAQMNYVIKTAPDGAPTLYILCTFRKNFSWKNPEKLKQVDDKPYLLNHEQGHFDLEEVITRRMRKEFAEYCAAHKKSPTFNTDIEQIFKKLTTASQALQDQYDNETNHSKNKAKQEEWNKKIAAMLTELNQYARKL